MVDMMSRLHDMKTGVCMRHHFSQQDEINDQKNKVLYRRHSCYCPECGKNFENVGNLIEHQDAMQCGIIPL